MARVRLLRWRPLGVILSNILKEKAMILIELTCPNCGGTMNVPETKVIIGTSKTFLKIMDERNTIVCNHCSSEFVEGTVLDRPIEQSGGSQINISNCKTGGDININNSSKSIIVTGTYKEEKI
jgi:RNase P subunit RPR2